MKKTYINPELEIVKIETHKMLAESFTLNNNPETIVEDPGNILSREAEFDFEEEELYMEEEEF